MALVTVSGYPGSGTTTVVGILRRELGLPSFNVGDLFRVMAREKGLSLADLHLHARHDASIDRALDERQVAIAEKGNVILEGRLAGFLTRRAGLDAYRVWLDAPIDVRAARVAKRENVSTALAYEEVGVRQFAERTRYLLSYHFDLDCHEIYDFVADTSALTPEAIAAKVVADVRGRTGRESAVSNGEGLRGDS